MSAGHDPLGESFRLAISNPRTPTDAHSAGVLAGDDICSGCGYAYSACICAERERADEKRLRQWEEAERSFDDAIDLLDRDRKAREAERMRRLQDAHERIACGHD